MIASPFLLQEASIQRHFNSTKQGTCIQGQRLQKKLYGEPSMHQNSPMEIALSRQEELQRSSSTRIEAVCSIILYSAPNNFESQSIAAIKNTKKIISPIFRNKYEDYP
jgi:hypothetical protein